MAADTNLDSAMALALAVAEVSDDDDFQQSGKQLALKKQERLFGGSGRRKAGCMWSTAGKGHEGGCKIRKVISAGSALHQARLSSVQKGRICTAAQPRDRGLESNAERMESLCHQDSARTEVKGDVESVLGTQAAGASGEPDFLSSAPVAGGSQLNVLLSLCSRATEEAGDSESAGLSHAGEDAAVEVAINVPSVSLVSNGGGDSALSEEDITSFLTQVSTPRGKEGKRHEGDVPRASRPPLGDITNVVSAVSGSDGSKGLAPHSRYGDLVGTSVVVNDSRGGECAEEAAPVDGCFTVESLSSGVLTPECPICQLSLGGLPFPQREAHTNACLDKLDMEQEVNEGTCSPGAGLGPVLQWLEKLNLSKYAHIFIREEIDWDTLQWLKEEDLLGLGIAALGPRRKIISEIRVLKSGKDLSTAENSEVGSQEKLNGNTTSSSAKRITDFFAHSAGSSRTPHATVQQTSQCTNAAPVAPPRANPSASSNRNLCRKISPPVPPWMCIPGTSFRVDAFRHLTTECCHWFLTHFHTDHYQGLTRAFRHGKIYCSAITAALVNMQIGVPLSHIEVIDLNKAVTIDGVKVTFIDANHCPGSVMILFQLACNKNVLHTGDFRYCTKMANEPVLLANTIHTLILDTTYCDPQYDFPEQDAAVQFVIEAIQAETFNPKTLFLIGTYTIGKERVFLEVGRALQKKVYVGAAKRRLLSCMALREDETRWLTSNDQESQIHVVPLWSIASFKRMGSISRHYRGRYNSVVALSLTGWNFGRDKKRFTGRRKQQGAVIRYEVPYSEHSSFSELKQFLELVDPATVIPSVVKDDPADVLVARLLADKNGCVPASNP